MYVVLGHTSQVEDSNRARERKYNYPRLARHPSNFGVSFKFKATLSKLTISLKQSVEKLYFLKMRKVLFKGESGGCWISLELKNNKNNCL